MLHFLCYLENVVLEEVAVLDCPSISGKNETEKKKCWKQMPTLQYQNNSFKRMPFISVCWVYTGIVGYINKWAF